jgi:predicted transcriptional regulator
VGAMKRNRHEIIYDILTICISGANKTKIVYEGNLNFRTTNHYLNDLIKSNFINKEQDGYHTTQRGISLLESMNLVNAQLYGPDITEPATS